MIHNVVNPSLTVYLPEDSKATGTAVIVAPGGGYRFLCWQNEGTKVADWLQRRGIAAFVLKYRAMDMGQTKDDFQVKMQEFMRQMRNSGNSNPPKELLKDPYEAGRGCLEQILANADYIKKPGNTLIGVILKGQSGEVVVNGRKCNAIMQAQEYLTDVQIAAVVNYVRNSWGNKIPGAITPAMWKTLRK